MQREIKNNLYKLKIENFKKKKKTQTLQREIKVYRN